MRHEYFNLPPLAVHRVVLADGPQNKFHFLKLRMESHAQWENQEYGRRLAEFEGKLNTSY